jgi:FixJ family two-component response regulator
MSTPRVFLVDDEPALRRALERLLKSEGFTVESFGSAAEFLRRLRAEDTGCVVLDVSMPEVDGLELQRRLADHAAALAIVFLTAHGDIPMSVEAMRRGAQDFLTKPVKGTQLVAAVHAALNRAGASRQERRALTAMRDRLEQLTPRERDVLEHVITGRLNKVIANHLGVTEQTVKVHRGRVMEKLGVGSVAELVRAAEMLGVKPAK